jgi:hypothetical protein
MSFDVCAEEFSGVKLRLTSLFKPTKGENNEKRKTR